jgi:hypothetical protein
MAGTYIVENPQWMSGNGITIERFCRIFVHCRSLASAPGIVMRIVMRETSKRIMDEAKTHESVEWSMWGYRV